MTHISDDKVVCDGNVEVGLTNISESDAIEHRTRTDLVFTCNKD